LTRTLFERSATAVQAVSFWATVALPLVIAVALATGTVATAPKLVTALVPLTMVCALCSRSYSPRL